MISFLRATLQHAKTNTGGIQLLAGRRCSTAPEAEQHVKDVPGLSTKVVKMPCEDAGFPNASKEGVYKNPEYFCYNNVSYFEAEVEMLKYRLPQPSNKTKN